MAKKVLEAADVAGRIGDRTRSVGLKPNLVTSRAPETGATTHAELLEGAIEYLQEHGSHDFNLMGYDLLRRNVECLKQGSIFFLIAQQPVLQGFDGIKALCDHLILKKPVERENFMPVDLLTKENIDFYSSAKRM